MVSSSKRDSESARERTEPPPDRTVGSEFAVAETNITSVKEIRPGSAEIWQPNNFQEWIELKRVDAILDAWSEQAKHERGLRISSAKWIFSLIAAQVFAVFGIMLLIGLQVMSIEAPVLQVLIGAVCADVFGLGFAVTRFLYREPLKIELDSLLRHSAKRGPDAVARPADPTG